MKQKVFLLAIGLFFTAWSYGQTAGPELVSSAGDSFSNSTYQLDFSVGEAVTGSHSAGDYAITHGFQQINYLITPVDDIKPDLKISVFPNPASNNISINFDELSDSHKASYTITDISGRLLQSSEIESKSENVKIGAYTAGTYFISISLNNQIVKSFQIIKK